MEAGQSVHAGQQLAWAASSGSSSWPHLHFTELVDGAPRDPFAGPCRAGPSDFASQPQPFRDAPYVRNLVVSPRPFKGQAQLPWDDAARTGTFVRGTRDVWLRLELGEYAGGAERVQIVRPDGSLAVDEATPAKTVDGIGQGHGAGSVRRARARAVRRDRNLAAALPARRQDARRCAASRGRAGGTGAQPAAELGDRLDGRDERDRAVHRRDVTLRAAIPTSTSCATGTAGAPARGVLRTVTSAALSDVLPLPASGTVRCEVTPSDGKLAGRRSARLLRLEVAVEPLEDGLEAGDAVQRASRRA